MAGEVGQADFIRDSSGEVVGIRNGAQEFYGLATLGELVAARALVSGGGIAPVADAFTNAQPAGFPATVPNVAASSVGFTTNVYNSLTYGQRFERPSGRYRHWKFNPATGAMFDVLGNADSFTDVGTVTTAPHSVQFSDTARRFNGSSQRITAPVFPFENTDSFTIEAIVTPNITRSGGSLSYDILNCQIVGGTARGVSLTLAWDGSSTAKIGAGIISDFGASDRLFISGYGVDIPNGVPCHVVVRYEGGSTRRMLVQVNGQTYSGGFVQKTDLGSIASGLPMQIGGRSDGTRWFNGTISEVVYYSRALTFQEMQALHKNATSTPNSVVFFTDLASDGDDINNLVTLCALSRQGTIDLRAVITDSANADSGPCARAILDWCGLKGVPVGSWQGATPGGAAANSSYTASVRSRFRSGETRATSSLTDASTRYRLGFGYNDPNGVARTAIATAQPGTVTILTAGYAGQLAGFLASASDSISTLTGAQLVAAQCRDIYCVAGYYHGAISTTVTNGVESNITNDITNWNTVFGLLNNLCPVYMVGIELGQAANDYVPTNGNPLTNPVQYAYDLYFAATTTRNRPVWAQIAITAMLERKRWRASAPGKVEALSNGEARMLFTSPFFNHRYLIERDGSEPAYVAALNQTLVSYVWNLGA